MAKVIKNVTYCFWICVICGGGGAGYDLYMQTHRGVDSPLLGIWLIFTSLSVVFSLLKSGLKNLDKRLARLERAKVP